MNKNKHILSLLAVLVFSFLAIASTESEDVIEGEISDIEPEVTVAATVLCSEYQENEIAADLKYNGKVLLVTGTIEDIGKDLLDSIYVSLTDGEEFSLTGVQCFFSDSQASVAANLKKGQKISIKGKCDGLMGNVMLKGCTVE